VIKIWASRWESQQEEEQALSLLLLSFGAESISSKACSKARHSV
jgi:hypothetical protein